MSSPRRSLASLRREVGDCRRCPLWEHATQGVFGEGARRGLMLVGEQPGDVEDREGRPFVGPAGNLLRELIAEAGVPEETMYLTNAVKHFKWKPASSGKRRIHDKPSWSEVQACSHWLGLELAAVRPAVLVCLGATAAQSVLGRAARVGELRGEPVVRPGLPTMIVTYHPSAVLRAQDQRESLRAELVSDLKVARAHLAAVAEL